MYVCRMTIKKLKEKFVKLVFVLQTTFVFPITEVQIKISNNAPLHHLSNIIVNVNYIKNMNIKSLIIPLKTY